MSEQLTADVLFTLRAGLVAFAVAWGLRGLRGTLKVRSNWHTWATVLAIGVVVIGGYAAWRCLP